MTDQKSKQLFTESEKRMILEAVNYYRTMATHNDEFCGLKNNSKKWKLCKKIEEKL